MLFSDEQTHTQERRASARRGCWETHLQHRYRSRPGTLVTCGDKSGERQPAVDVGNALATALPLSYGSPLRCVCRWPLHSRPGRTRGAYAPRSWLYMRLCIAKVAISPARVRALKQERRASARRGVRKRICKGASAKSRETAGSLCADRRCSRGSEPRGAYAPRSCIAVRTSVGKKTIFSMHKRTFARAAGVSPPWVLGNALATPIPLTSGDTRHVRRHERRASARRG
jgi:hypothetical protein